MRPTSLLTTFAIALFALAAAGTPVVAGYKASHPIVIDAKHGYVYGSLPDTRATPDAVQGLSCAVIAFNTWSAASCSGCTLNECFYCSSYEPRMIEAASAVSGGSYVWIDWDASTGECTQISTYNTSTYAPPQP